MASTTDLRLENLFSVKGYKCVVTGGGTGIGLMATQVLAANGATVYITGRRLEVLENAAKTHSPTEDGQGRIIPVGPCDVTKKEDLEWLVAQISQKEEHIDLLITNAGTSGPRAWPDEPQADNLKEKLWSNESVPDWSSVFTTNVTSVYFTTVAFLPLLQTSSSAFKTHARDGPTPPSEEQSGPTPATAQTHRPRTTRHGASVIVISSMSGLMKDSQGHFSYNAAKAGTIHLAKMMSAEFEKAEVRVNSIAPGYFPSEMTTGGQSDDRQKSHVPDQKIKDKGNVPAERPGSDEEMGQAVVFLTKNTYVNGEVLVVDGGTLLKVPGAR
ncbi:MAG: hypothetical protein M4579_007277 [Chaenotheca gracillima]|nr:MAG: hypothetical protein M4579_007277 [Chaenotheca gracillima]